MLASLAKCNYDDTAAINVIGGSIVKFAGMLKGHASWEEYFVFKVLPFESIETELEFHRKIDTEIDEILADLNSSKSSADIYKCYLRFRKFYSELLAHLYEEEVKLMDLIQKGFLESKLRMIDHEIYQGMSAKDMIEMCAELLPPCSFSEKRAILEDLMAANKKSFAEAYLNLLQMFTNVEQQKLFKIFE